MSFSQKMNVVLNFVEKYVKKSEVKIKKIESEKKKESYIIITIIIIMPEYA